MKDVRFRLLVFLLVLALLLIQRSPVEAGSAVRADPGTALKPLTAAGVAAFVDQYVAQGMAAAHAPGLVITVVQGDEVLLSRGYGLADLETGRPMTPQTALRAGSVSKPVTSAAVLQLVAQGGLALDEPVSRYLPALLPDDGYGPAGTVAQLLTLQGGYADTVVQTHAPTLDEWQPLDEYLQERLPERVQPPGKVLSYNSWEHALLGQAVAEQMGRPFDRAIAKLLLQPLGMAHSTFTQPLPPAVAGNLATGYAFDGKYEVVPLDYVNLTPGIGLVTSGEDMGRFMRALLDEGRLDGQQVLAPATVTGMLERQLPVHPLSRSRTFGLSEITLDGRQVLYQDGNGIGFGNRLILAPKHRLGIFISTNHRPLAGDISSTPAFTFIKELGTALLRQYLPASIADDEVLPALADATERAGRYAGHYRLAGTPQDDFFKLGALLDNVDVADNEDGTLTIGSNHYREVEPLLFQSTNDPGFFVVFAENEAGEVQWLTFGGTNSYAKVRWYETPLLQMTLVAFVLPVFLGFVIAMPFSGERHWTVWLMSLLNLLFLAGLAYMMMRADLVLFFKTIPLGTRLLFLLPWLSAVLALTLFPALVRVWRQDGSWLPRLLYSANALASSAFLWFVFYWNLYRWF